MKTFFLQTAILLATSSAIASVDQIAVDKAVEELRPIVLTVTEPFYVFHYARLSDDVQQRWNPEDPKVKDHFKNWVQYYWDRSQDETIKGYVHGLYAATDPVKSRSYAHEDGPAFFMNRIEIPPGFAILDLSKAPMPSTTVQGALKKANCADLSYRTLFGAGRGHDCRDLQLSILAALKVDAFNYNYGYDPLPECIQDQPLQEQVAMVILRTDHLTQSAVATFVGADGPPEQSEERSTIQGIIHNSRDQKVRDYKAAHLLVCRNLRR